MCPKHQPVTKFAATGLGKTCCVDNRSLRHFRSSRDHQSSPVQALARVSKRVLDLGRAEYLCDSFLLFLCQVQPIHASPSCLQFPDLQIGRVGATDLTCNATRMPITVYRKLLKSGRFLPVRLSLPCPNEGGCPPFHCPSISGCYWLEGRFGNPGAAPKAGDCGGGVGRTSASYFCFCSGVRTADTRDSSSSFSDCNRVNRCCMVRVVALKTSVRRVVVISLWICIRYFLQLVV